MKATRFITALSLGLLLGACNGITVFVNNPKPALPIVADLQLTDEGHFQLRWATKGSASSFKIYMKTSPLPPEDFASAQSLNFSQSEFLLLKSNKVQQKILEEDYSLVASVEEKEYRHSDIPDPSLYYSFAVVPSTLDGKNISGNHYIAKIEMGVPSNILLADSDSNSHKKLSWDEVPGALQYAIYKDDTQTEALLSVSLNQVDIEAYLERYPSLCVRSLRGRLVSPHCQPIAVSGSRAFIASISSPTPNGYYKTGDPIYFEVNYSGAVNVTGTPSLPLSNQSKATFVSGSGSNRLLFRYQIQAGEDIERLDVENGQALSLPLGSSIQAGGDVSLFLPRANEGVSFLSRHLISVDTVAPTPPANVLFAKNLTSTPDVSLSWAPSEDINFDSYSAKLCEQNDCQTSCTPATESLTEIRVLTGSHGRNYYGCVRAEDKAGLSSAWISSLDFVTIDTQAPSVLKVESLTADGYYKENSDLDLRLVMTEAVVLTGSSELTLDIAGTPRKASYISGSGSDSLLFRYRIQNGDTSSRLDLKDASSFVLSAGSSLKDIAGNDADLTLPVGAHSASLKSLASLVIDTSPPTAPSGINFQGAVSGTTALAFYWSAATDANLLQYNTKICTNNDCATSCISPLNANTLDTTATGVDGGVYYACVRAEDRVQHYSSWVASSSPITVDLSMAGVVRVESPTPAGLYSTGFGIDIDVVFSKIVNVSNEADLQLALNLNAAPRHASYLSGSGSNTLRFRYVIQAGDASSDLAYAGSASLALGATGRIRDNGNVDAILTLPSAGSGQALVDLEAISVDTTPPTSPSAVVFAGSYSTILAIPFSWTAATDDNLSHYNVKLCTSDNCSTACIGETTASPTSANITGANGTSYYACVQAEDEVSLTSAWVASAASIAVDTSPPTITSIDSSSANGDYDVGNDLEIQVNFSETVAVTNPNNLGLSLSLGGASTATYLSGGGTNQLTFVYTITANDDSQDLEVASTTALTLGASGTIKDAAGWNAVLTNPITGPNSLSSRKDIVVDTTDPTAASSVGFSAAHTNSTNFNVLWVESSDLNFNTHNVKVCENSDCSTDCSSVVQSATSPVGQSGVDGKTYYGCVQGRDRLGHLSAYSPSLTTLRVDTTPPTVSSVTSNEASSLFKIGSAIAIQVTFSETVNLANGTDISLLMANGGAGTLATYSSGSGTDTLTFFYTVASGDVSTDLEVTSASALVLGSGTTLKDIVGNDAVLTLPPLGGGLSLSGSRTIVIDGIRPTAPSSVEVNDYVETLNPSREVQWTDGSDANFKTHNVTYCESSDCSASCMTGEDSLTSPKTLVGAAGKTFYACVRAEDQAGNTSAWAASPQSFTIDPSPVFGGATSVEVLESWTGQDAKIKVSFANVPSGHITHYKVYFSTSSSLGSFDLNAPLATIPYGDATFDANTGDDFLLLARPAVDIEDGYYLVRYVDQGGYFPDPNTAVVTSYVLPGKPGYKFIPKGFTGLAYDFFIMKYEASLGAGSRPGGDLVTTDPTNLARCAAEFHTNGVTNHASCGTKNTQAPAVSALGVAPRNYMSWNESFFACRNASTATAKVRMPTMEEWSRATRSFYASYSEALTFMTSNTATSCNVSSGSTKNTGFAPACKSAMGLSDAVGNLSEWVDYRIEPQTYNRFGRTASGAKLVRNGIDNITMQYPDYDTVNRVQSMSMGSYWNSMSSHNNGTNMLGFFVASDGGIPGIGVRCVAFRSDSLPTMDELALAEQPKYTSAELAEPVATRRFPESKYVGDDKPETLSIVINGNTADTVAEGEIQLSWKPWSKTTCDTNGSCGNSDAGLSYKLYRFIDPNFYGLRLSNAPWALNIAGSAYPADVVLDPIGIDSAWNPLWTSSGTHGRLLATINNCNSATPGNCAFTDSTSAGTAFSPNEIYLYVLVVGTSDGNFRYAEVQRNHSAYAVGGHTVLDGGKNHAFRLEPRFRRASVFVADTAYQAARTIPQVMVHVPMDVSGFDRDFFIYKYEASRYSGSVSGGGGGAGSLPLVPGICFDSIRRQNSITVADCGVAGYINYTDIVTQSKSGQTPFGTLDNGDAIRSCVNTVLTDGSGRNYRLHLPSGQEWFKAADWGDLDFDGTIDQNAFTSGETSISLLQDGSTPDAITVRCHSDNNPSSAYATGSAETANCVSRYGAENMVGNVAEWTMDRVNNYVGQDSGDAFMWAFPSPTTAGTASTLTYSLFSAFPMSSGSTVYSLADQFLPPTTNGYYYGTRGGSYDSSHGTPGRFTLDLSHGYGTQDSKLGLRCAY